MSVVRLTTSISQQTAARIVQPSWLRVSVVVHMGHYGMVDAATTTTSTSTGFGTMRSVFQMRARRATDWSPPHSVVMMLCWGRCGIIVQRKL